MLERLGSQVYRYRHAVLATWAAVIVVGAVLGGGIFDRTMSVDSMRADAESARADQLIEHWLGEGSSVVAVAQGRHPRDPVLVDSIIAVGAELRTIDGVVDVEDGYTAPGGAIGADNNSVLIAVELDPTLSNANQERTESAVADVLHQLDAPTVLVGGETLAERAFAEQAVQDAAAGEAVALTLLFVVLTAIFGGVLVGMLPLATALTTITAALLGLAGLMLVMPVSEFTINVVTLLGIGLAVDYSIVLLYRFGEERVADPDAGPAQWIARTMATSGRAVVISGLAVFAAMAGLSVLAEPLLGSIALGGAIVALLATVVAVTAVPALIAVVHRRIPRAEQVTWVRRLLRQRTLESGPGVVARLAAFAWHRPRVVAATATAVLLTLALPVAAINLDNSDARSLPASMEARQTYAAVQADFRDDRPPPVEVVIEADDARPEVRDLLNDMLTLPQVHQLQVRPDLPQGITVVDLTPIGEPGGAESRDLVRAVRELPTELPVVVGGQAAEVVDYAESLADRLPVVIGVLLVASMALLFALTGSVVIPLKAIVLNVLSMLATLGILVVVFQWGVGERLLGFDSWGALDLTTPVFLLVFIYGLTMDYEVFMLARITEEHQRGAGRDAVLRGISATGPVVSTAALAIVIVFAGFVLGELVAIKEVGFGMAVAIALDVTIIRGLLLPALMALLGGWNWWAPRSLRRLHRAFTSAPSRGSVSAAAG